jgi:hypothetical protein
MIFAAPIAVTVGLLLALVVIVSAQGAMPAARPVRVAVRRPGARR